MNELRARDLLSDGILFAEAEQQLHDFPALLEERRASHVAVFEEGRFLGLVSLRNSVHRFPTRIFADLLTTSDRQSVRDDMPVSELQDLDWGAIDAVAVVNAAGEFVGAVTQSSLIAGLWKEQVEARQRIQQLFGELRLTMRRAVMMQMASAFAHDVHQPLAAIANYAQGAKQGLKRGNLSPEKLEYAFEEILELCDSASQIVRQVRSFVRDRKPDPAKCQLVEVFQNAIELARPALDEHAVDYSLQFPEDLPGVWGDSASLTYAMYNLILNAAQATARSQSGLRNVWIQIHNPDAEWIEVTVEDNGDGIPPEFRSQLFDPFFTTIPGNDGLGLALCRSLISQLGGEMRLEGREPHGCRVWLTLRTASPTPTVSLTDPYPD